MIDLIENGDKVRCTSNQSTNHETINLTVGSTYTVLTFVRNTVRVINDGGW